MLTMGAAMTCFSGILFSIDPFQLDQKWVILVKKKTGKREGKKHTFLLTILK